MKKPKPDSIHILINFEVFLRLSQFQILRMISMPTLLENYFRHWSVRLSSWNEGDVVEV